MELQHFCNPHIRAYLSYIIPIVLWNSIGSSIQPLLQTCRNHAYDAIVIGGHPPRTGAAADLLPNHGIVGWNSQQVPDTIRRLIKNHRRESCVQTWYVRNLELNTSRTDHIGSPIFHHLSIFHLAWPPEGLVELVHLHLDVPFPECSCLNLEMLHHRQSECGGGGVELAPGPKVCSSPNQLGVLPGVGFFWAYGSLGLIYRFEGVL